jgi:cytochrome P450
MSPSTVAANAPRLDLDLYGRSSLLNPIETYRRIRDAGAVVWLPKHRLWVMGRYHHVREALRDDATYLSGAGVAANPLTNALSAGTTLASDAETHMQRRRVLLHSLSAKALASAVPALREEASALVARLVDRGPFEGVSQFAAHLPVRVVADLVGVTISPARMLAYGRAGFDGLGPCNGRTLKALPTGLRFWRYSRSVQTKNLKPGGWAEAIMVAQREGNLNSAEAQAMVMDFIGPSLDTTILASAHLLWSMGNNPAVWNELRADPKLIPAAVTEAVRLASPIRGFARIVARDTEVDGVELKRGHRVVLLFASANMDETQFAHPGGFSLQRKGSNLGWGFGAHACAGMHLSRLEMQALLEALVAQVARIDVEKSKLLINNTLQGFRSMQAKFSGEDSSNALMHQRLRS